MTARSIRRALERKQKKLARKAERQNPLLETAAAAAPVPSIVRPAMEDTEIETAVSPARLAANRQNALLSTGPRTPEGQAKSSLNAASAQGEVQPVVRVSTWTGLTGRTVLLPSDDVAEYERHLAAYAEEFAPVGLLETNLVQSIADTDWRLRRIPALESALFAKGRIEFAELFNEQDLAARPHLIDAHTFITYEKQIRNLQLQEARLARRREREIAELRKLQAERMQKQQQEIPANGFVFSTPQTSSFSAAISAVNPHTEPRTSVRGFGAEHRS
ncbi:MAG TPA: hypothetical protein VH369_00845 [Bryobacteraceae bacterium]|jgi:hypothetical protein